VKIGGRETGREHGEILGQSLAKAQREVAAPLPLEVSSTFRISISVQIIFYLSPSFGKYPDHFSSLVLLPRKVLIQ